MRPVAVHVNHGNSANHHPSLCGADPYYITYLYQVTYILVNGNFSPPPRKKQRIGVLGPRSRIHARKKTKLRQIKDVTEFRFSADKPMRVVQAGLRDGTTASETG